MKPKQLLSALLTGALSMGMAMMAGAQPNPNLHIVDPANVSNDYMPVTNEYLLSGRFNPPTIAGMNNSAPFGFLPRIQLEVVDDPTMTTTMFKTYCTAQEVSDYLQQKCTTLSVAFYQADARQTADQGHILCGSLVRTPEFTICPAPDLHHQYLIKTNPAGGVVWFKRYDIGWDHRAWFKSVIEDPATGNFVVCGEMTPGPGAFPVAFMMGVDPLGNLLWAHNTITTQYGTGTPITATYTEVTTYKDMLGNSYLALTGEVGYGSYYGGGINTGGGLLTVIDGNGTIFSNVYITEDGNNRFMQLKGINDAHDGDVVLTGFSGGNCCCAHTGFNLLIIKINPLTYATAFHKVYSQNPANMFDVSFGTSITVNHLAAASQTIEVTGNHNGGLVGSSNNAVYVQTNYAGGLMRYVNHAVGNGVDGVGIVLNTTNNYPAWSGTSPTGTFLTKYKYGIFCDPDVTPSIIDLPREIVTNTITDPPVIEIPDNLIAFDMPPTESLICGTLKPGRNTAAATAPDHMKLAPNPADNYIDVQLPATLQGGTVKVYDMTGRQVSSQKAGSGTLHVDIKHLSAGMYMLTAESDGIREHVTFVKN